MAAHQAEAIPPDRVAPSGAERRLPAWEERPEPATSPGLRELLDRAVRATS